MMKDEPSTMNQPEKQPESSTNAPVSLAIELSNPNATNDAHHAALFGADGSLVGSMAIPSGVRSADGLMLLISKLCEKYSVVPDDIAKVIVSVGPGGYTSLRIATTTAKVLAHAIGCKVVAVPSALIAGVGYAKECDQDQGEKVLVALASKKQLAHCSVIAADGTIDEIGIVDAPGLEALIANRPEIKVILSDDHLPESFVDMAKTNGMLVEAIDLDARWCLEASAGIEAVEPIDLMLKYAREPDAVTQWRVRHSG
jgi:tRNA A37 threonylcarbamoyladenosine modification protein TsaB